MRFRTTVQATGGTTTGLPVPDEVVNALGAGKRPKVRVTIGSHTWRSSIASMGGGFMIGLSGENRSAAGVGAGDEVEVNLELDSEPREVTVPPELAAALDADPEARRTFDSLSYSKQRWHVLAVEGAKSDETRQRRIAKSLELLRGGG